MNTYLAFVRKEALHILRDRRTLLVVVLLPIVQILLFGFAISTEVNDLRIRVAATDRLTDAGRIAARLDASPYLRCEALDGYYDGKNKYYDSFSYRSDRKSYRSTCSAQGFVRHRAHCLHKAHDFAEKLESYGRDGAERPTGYPQREAPQCLQMRQPSW